MIGGVDHVVIAVPDLAEHRTEPTLHGYGAAPTLLDAARTRARAFCYKRPAP
ncbi:MAG TPA: hypothetical protein VMI09_09005 [Candidatus Binataceae bacterium]|nr:hypothetical protein [Candidatus Binataceae bacterium]